MNLAEKSSAGMEHLSSKRVLSDRSAEDKSCNNHNVNKRMKHHQERQFGKEPPAKANGPASSSTSGDESDDDSSPFNLAKPTPQNSTTTSKSLPPEDGKQHKPVNKVDLVKEYRKNLPVALQDDSSSTSNCSCEQHSNDEKDEEDFHEKLDYDEDSITDSPLGSSLPSNNNNSNHVLITSSDRSSSVTATVPEEEESNLITKVDDRQNREKQQQTTTTLKPSASPSPSSDHRLKSVINLNHKPSTPEKYEIFNRVSSERSSPRSYNSLLRYLFKDTCFFQMKSINHENIKISKSMGIWSTPVSNELRLNLAFKEHKNVILIFSVQQSGGFQGFARMVSESEPATKPLPWILPKRLSSKALRGVFKVQWICKKELPFHLTQDLYNPYNDNKPVKVARDGQQVESRTGKKLCKLFQEDDRDKLLETVSLMKHQTSQRKKYPQRYDNNESYPFAYRQSHDMWRRDTFQYNHHYNDEHHRRSNERLNFNYRNFESNSFPTSFNNSLPRLPPGPYPHHHYQHHHPLHNPPSYPLSVDQYPPPDVWLEKPIMARHDSRDYRPKR